MLTNKEIKRTIRLTKELDKDLVKKAKIKNLSISRFIRELIIININKNFLNGLKIFESLLFNCFENSKTFSNLGSNLNQIAYQLNSNRAIEEDELISLLNKIEKLTKKISRNNNKYMRLLRNLNDEIII